MIDFAPMLAAAAPEPFDSDDFLFEIKWDGIRCLASIVGGSTRLYSRNGRDITRLFPELVNLSTAMAGATAVLDGELCVLDGATPNFHHIQRRVVLSADISIERTALKHPALYIVFDLLHLDGTDLFHSPLANRRQLLETVWRGDDYAVLSTGVPGRGRDLYAAAVARGLEGIVAKRLDSPYVPGRRTGHWLKIRHHRELDGVIGGYTPKGTDDFASLAVGLYVDRHPDGKNWMWDEPSLNVPAGRPLVYIGNVGTGFAAALRRDLMRRLATLQVNVSPFASPKHLPKDTRWVHPQLVCRVRYLHFTPAGHLRQPTFLGLRVDKSPYECTWSTGKPDGITLKGYKGDIP